MLLRRRVRSMVASQSRTCLIAEAEVLSIYRPEFSCAGSSAALILAWLADDIAPHHTVFRALEHHTIAAHSGLERFPAAAKYTWCVHHRYLRCSRLMCFAERDLPALPVDHCKSHIGIMLDRCRDP